MVVEKYSHFTLEYGINFLEIRFLDSSFSRNSFLEYFKFSKNNSSYYYAVKSKRGTFKNNTIITINSKLTKKPQFYLNHIQKEIYRLVANPYCSSHLSKFIFNDFIPYLLFLLPNMVQNENLETRISKNFLKNNIDNFRQILQEEIDRSNNEDFLKELGYDID